MSLLHKIRRLSVERKNSNALNNDIALCHLISKQAWDRVEHMLNDESNELLRINVPQSGSATITDDLIVHYALQCDAPLRIVMALSTLFPSSICSGDDYGRYPLHVAVKNGCRPELIEYLVQANPDAARIQDSFGKTPIHYAGETYAEELVGKVVPDLNAVHHFTLRVVELLVEAGPESVNLEDENEMNPIEHAIVNGVHIRILKTMQRASRKEWRRKSEEGKPPDAEALKNLQRSPSGTSENRQDKTPGLIGENSSFGVHGRRRTSVPNRLGALSA